MMDWERTDEGRKLFNEAWQNYGRDADMALAEWCAKAEAVADARKTELARLREVVEHALGHADKPDEMIAILRAASEQEEP